MVEKTVDIRIERHYHQQRQRGENHHEQQPGRGEVFPSRASAARTRGGKFQRLEEHLSKILQVADQGSDDGAEVKKDAEGLHIKARGRHAEEIEKNAQVRSTGHRDKLRHSLYQPVK